MKEFWPSAIAIMDDGREEKLFTSDSVFTFEKAREQFSVWAIGYGYRIISAWIDVKTQKGEGRINFF